MLPFLVGEATEKMKKVVVSHNGVNRLVDYEPVASLLGRACEVFSIATPCALEYYDRTYKLNIRVTGNDIPKDESLCLVELHPPALSPAPSVYSGSTV